MLKISVTDEIFICFMQWKSKFRLTWGFYSSTERIQSPFLLPFSRYPIVRIFLPGDKKAAASSVILSSEKREKGKK